MKRALLLFAILALFRRTGFHGGAAPGRRRARPLRMEELEVRGLREKPEVLYLPVHSWHRHPFPGSL